MFSSFYNVWSRFCYDFLGLRDLWLGIAVFIPVRLALLEIKLKHGSLREYLVFCHQEEEKERLAKHCEGFRDLGLK